MPRNQGLAVEMTLRGRKSVILTARSSRCPRSLETRTERGFPHFHGNGCGPICQNYKIRQNRKGLQILVQNPIFRAPWKNSPLPRLLRAPSALTWWPVLLAKAGPRVLCGFPSSEGNASHAFPPSEGSFAWDAEPGVSARNKAKKPRNTLGV